MLKIKHLIWFCLVLTLCGCKTAVNAPKGTVPRRTELTEDTFGGWISINYLIGSNTLNGELIALTTDSVYVLTNSGVETVLLQDVEKARLIFYKTDTQRFATWTALGSLTSLTNGYFFIFSLPLWVATGVVTSNEEANRDNFIDFPEHPWAEFRKYARFPQGVGAEVLLEDLELRIIEIADPGYSHYRTSGPGSRH